MGILNVTPDSFSDGGEYEESSSAVRHAMKMLEEGATWVDVGGESTRPGAPQVSVEVELARILPVIEGIVTERPGALVSVDTSKVEVAKAAVSAGAKMVNDVSGCSSPAMAELCAAHNAKLVLMHMRGTPQTMQNNTRYQKLEHEVAAFLTERQRRCLACGMKQSQVIIDPGLGFGKSWEDNFRLIRAIPKLMEVNPAVMIGASRKRFIGECIGKDVPRDRVYGSVGVALAAADAGATMLRVHDVAATAQALQTFWKARHP